MLPATSVYNKVTLPQTSIDSPALSSVLTLVQGQSFNRSAIAWTGTDAAHHLNVERSAEGLTFFDKRTLGETSPFRPDVTQIGQPEGGFVTVAWTGTDANHSLNILPITVTGISLVPGTKTILSQFSSNAGPHLTSGGSTSLVLSWTSRALGPMAAVANSPDLQFGLVATLPQTSAFAPDTLFISAVQGPPVWISWTGTDAAHHLNLQFTTTYPAFPNAKTVLSDTAFGGPALALEQVAMAVPVAFPQLAWTGTDSAHHLNIAKIQM